MTKKSRRNLIILSCVLGILIIPNFLVRIIPSKARLALPKSATDIHEEYDGCVFYDFSRILKAKLPKKDYLLFIENYGGLTKYNPSTDDENILSMINAYYGQAPQWWTKNYKRVNEGYFISEPGDYFVRVKYYDGYLYFFETRT
jgi:hypothetical protein